MGENALIISRTPFRVSFVGGGTDLESFYQQEEGRVLSTSIDKYVYVVVKKQIGIVEFKYRVNWSHVEFRNTIDEIEHPIVREALRIFEIDFPIEITTFADIPAGTGMGSSSAFAVGLVHALYALKGEMVTKYQLASLAKKIEVDILKRTMGGQDHFASAYGNINVINFHKNHQVSIEPVFYTPKIKEKLEQHLMLFYIGNKRNASEILKNQVNHSKSKHNFLAAMKNMVTPLQEVVSGYKPFEDFGLILNENWELKRQLSAEVSSKVIDDYYQKAKNAGAVGGKLLGAGGGGFLLLFVDPRVQNKVRNILSNLYELPFKFDVGGSRITYYDQTKI